MGPELKAGIMAAKPQRLGQIVVDITPKDEDDEDEDDEDRNEKAKATRRKTKGKRQEDEEHSHEPAPRFSAVRGDLLFKAQAASKRRYGTLRIDPHPDELKNKGMTCEGGLALAEKDDKQYQVAYQKLKGLLEIKRRGAEEIFQKYDHAHEGMLTVEDLNSVLVALHVGITENERQAFCNHAVIEYGVDEEEGGLKGVRVDYMTMLKDIGGEMTRQKLEVEIRKREQVEMTHPTGDTLY